LLTAGELAPAEPSGKPGPTWTMPGDLIPQAPTSDANGYRVNPPHKSVFILRVAD
jgi:hypothetical protein